MWAWPARRRELEKQQVDDVARVTQFYPLFLETSKELEVGNSENLCKGHLGGLVVKRLSLTQVMIGIELCLGPCWVGSLLNS